MVTLLLKKQLRNLLEQNEPDTAEFEANQLLQWATGLDRSALMLETEVDDSAADKAIEAAHRRIKGEPLQYIIGQWEFYGLPFRVGEGVLIPRPETELLVEKAIERLPEKAVVVDLCSGSGCIPIAIAKAVGTNLCYGVELSKQALGYFEENIRLNGVDTDVIALQGDVLYPPEELLDDLPAKCSVITANPPYLTAEEMANLQKEVRREPESALFGGADGLDFYRVIFGVWKHKLERGGSFLVEVGDRQAESVRSLMEQEGFQCEIYCDLNKTGRVVAGKYP